MALKLTRTAAEILNDILLHTLQQNGLEKAETLEQQFFHAFSQLDCATSTDTLSTTIVDDFTLVYKSEEFTTIVLAILHTSRLSHTPKV